MATQAKVKITDHISLQLLIYKELFLGNIRAGKNQKKEL
jgi:hypothetical protein